MLCVGGSAWAQTTAFEQDFTAKEAQSTDPADYGFTLSYGAGSSSDLVKFSVTDGILKCDAGPYASASAGNRTGTATATFDAISTGNEVTVSYVWALGGATGNASGSYTKTRIGNGSGNALELSFNGSENDGSLKVNGTQVLANKAIRNTTYTVTAVLNMNAQKIVSLTLACSNNNYSYTATENIDFASAITSIDRFAFENSERQNWTNTSSIDNVKVTYVEAKELVESISVNYTFGGETIQTEEVTPAGLYCGDSYTVPFRMYIVKDGELYQTANNSNNPYYGENVTLTANTVVTKVLSKVNIGNGVIEFFQDFDGSDGNNAGIRASYCGAYDNKSFTSEEELPAGVYNFIVRAYSRNRGSSVKVGETEAFKIADVGGSWQNKTFENVAVEGGKLSFVKGGSGTIDPIDIIIAIRQVQPKSISAAGYATLFTDKALDFSETGLTAYVAVENGDDVSFEEVTTIPANTGVLLKGNQGDYTIPVTATAAEATSALVGVLVDTEVNAPIYVLLNGNEGVGFYKTTAAFTVGANTAYLPGTASARSFIGFRNEATGIKALTTIELDGKVYNMNGQRVAAPQKGLYIVNGKKTIIK